MFVEQEEEAEMIDQLDSEYIYSEIFRAFDLNGNGVIEKDDLMAATATADWNEAQGKWSMLI